MDNFFQFQYDIKSILQKKYGIDIINYISNINFCNVFKKNQMWRIELNLKNGEVLQKIYNTLKLTECKKIYTYRDVYKESLYIDLIIPFPYILVNGKFIKFKKKNNIKLTVNNLDKIISNSDALSKTLETDFLYGFNNPNLYFSKKPNTITLLTSGSLKINLESPPVSISTYRDDTVTLLDGKKLTLFDVNLDSKIDYGTYYDPIESKWKKR
jgi:hypothetical protein